MDHMYQFRTGASIGLIAASMHEVTQGIETDFSEKMTRGREVPFQQHRGTLLFRRRGVSVQSNHVHHHVR